MSDTSVSITPGSGANVDTRTEATNGNHRQVVVLGDPSVNAGVAPVDGTAGLKVDLGTDNDVTVSGTVTVDLGVNNDVTVTSGAITETNSAAIKTAVETIDNAISGSEMQVDVITMPTTTVQATDLDIRNLTNTDVVTAELSAVDNAVLDTIAAKDFATQTTLAAINTKLVSGTDIGDVTINNASGASAVNIQDGGNSITVDGTVTANLSATDNAVLDDIAADTEAIKTSLAGTLTVTGGGGGVEYTEGDTDATIVGSAIMWEDTSDTLRSVSAAKPLPVNIISGAGSGGTAAADDADFTATVTSGTPAMGVYESTPTNVTDGDLGVVGITTGRRMKTSATIDAALPAGTNNIGDVDVASSALPTGASTSANQSTIIGHLDGVEGLLTTIDADTSNLSVVGGGTEAAAIRVTIANNSTGVLSVDDNGGSLTIDGTVDLGATDNAVLDAIAASVASSDTSLNDIEAALETAGGLVVNLGANNDVTVTGTVDLGATDNAVLDSIAASLAGTLTVTGGGGGTEYTEDAAAAANPVGNAMILVREDARAGGLTTTDGDNVAARGNNKGEQYVIDTDANSKLTTITGHVDGIEGLLTTIDADTGNVSTKIDTIAGAVSGTEMQVDVLTMPTVTVTATNLDVQSGGADLATSTQAGAIQTSVQLLDDTVQVLGTDTYTEASSKGITLGAVRRDADTTLVNTTNEFTPLQVDANGRLKVEAFSGETLPVSLTSTTVTGTVAVTQSGTWDEVGINDSGNSITVDNGGTFVTQENGALLTAAQLIDDTIFADDAAVTLGTSKGSIAAGVAVQTDGTDPSAVSAEGDAAALRTDMNRILLVNQTHPRFWHVSADYASAQTNVSVKAAPGASLSLYITDIQLSNGATAGNVTLLDGSGGTVLYEVYPAINGGAVLSLRSPIKLTANTALCLTSTSVTTHSIFVSGYIAA